MLYEEYDLYPRNKYILHSEDWKQKKKKKIGGTTWVVLLQKLERSVRLAFMESFDMLHI